MKNSPLQVKIEYGELVVRIGIDTLAYCFEVGEDNNPYRRIGDRCDFIKWYRVLDAKEFALDIARAMNDERENGSTPLTDFLDKMQTAAIEGGSCAVEETEEYRNSKPA